jgi:glutamine---fructose-6-phosphate transaminase (isomerizing)
MTPAFNLDQQIASTPAVLRELLATAQVPELDPERPIVFTGVGTSLHAARVAAEWISRLTAGAVRPYALDAHDVGTTLPLTPRDQVVVISHRGTKTFPRASLERARAAGAATIAVVGRAAPPQDADATVVTCPDETAGTFSVSYVASLLALGLMAAPFDADGRQGFADGLRELPDAVAETIEQPGVEDVARALDAVEPLLIVGFGIDLATAQEAALKVKEGAWKWTEAMSPEFALHGTPASFHREMGAVVIEPGEDDGGRSTLLQQVLRELSLGAVVACAARPDAELPFVTPHPLLSPVTGIVPLQRLTAELARLRDSDPDTMHGGREPWRTVMTGLKL